ncbi:MAG TPA: SDR family oxidoreductase [Anaerolineales bacterium]|nr:SDR family oxidoreductase [Anaerolineales bacterium]
MIDLKGKTVLITGGARRLGRLFALACGRAGANVILHHGHSPAEAETVREEIASFGAQAWVLAADLSHPENASTLIERASELSPLYGLVNSASIFEPLTVHNTSLADWERHLAINLTAPFLLCQAFAKRVHQGRIVNILDWRALRPSADHFPYTVTKSALAAMTRSLALALAPHIVVNGLALGAILPPSDDPSAQEKVIEHVPAQRWSEAGEGEDALLFLLSGPAYITGEIIHVDGGRHLI